MIKEIFSRRNLIWELILKDLKVRYSRPMLGFLWAFLSPLLVVIIFYLVFSVILQVRTKEAPFFLYLMSAVFSWRFFQDSVISSTTSLIDNRNLIKESKFPQYLIPLSLVLSNAINSLPFFGILVITATIYLRGLPIFAIGLPLVLIIHLILTLGVSLIVSILYVKWRDLKYLLEAFLMILFYLTPVFYSLSLVKDSFPSFLFHVYTINPFVGMVSLYRITVLKGFYLFIRKEIELLNLLIIPVVFSVVILLFGIYFYKKNKDNINDYLSY
jgi:ABC-2 type transport system permease protein